MCVDVLRAFVLLTLVAGVGCGGSAGGPGGAAGSRGAGGVTATGGVPGSGGLLASGGTTASGGTSGGAGDTGSACSGSCSNAAAGSCSSPQVRVTSVNIGAALNYSTNETDEIPLALAAKPGGGSRMAWMTGYAHYGSSTA